MLNPSIVSMPEPGNEPDLADLAVRIERLERRRERAVEACRLVAAALVLLPDTRSPAAQLLTQALDALRSVTS